MMQKSTYHNWNFDDIWCIDEGNDYPKLKVFDSCNTTPVYESYTNKKSNLSFNPNPFSQSTTIFYHLQAPTQVVLKIYDALGIEVKLLVNEFQDAGEYQAVFDGSPLTSGIYYYTLKTGGSLLTGWIVLVK